MKREGKVEFLFAENLNIYIFMTILYSNVENDRVKCFNMSCKVSNYLNLH